MAQDRHRQAVRLSTGLTVSCVAEGVGEIPNVDQVATHPQRVTARSPMGLPINIWVVRPNEYGMQLLRETGSEEHLEQLLTRFSAQGLTTWEMVWNRLKGADEQALYHAIGLPLIPPELREGRDELQRIQGLHAPVLIESSEIQGFFHCHTDYSDGTGTLEDMVVAARAQGFTYVGISDHSQSATYAHGLKEPRVRRQWAEIQALQAKYRDIHIFRGIEADILPDGSMDYPDRFLAEFDFVIASVHSRFNLSEMEQTPVEREQVADERDRLADERERLADERERQADQRERAADVRDRAGTEPNVEEQPVPGEVDDDRFGINLGPAGERTEADDPDEPASPQPSPRTLSERLAAAAVDRDDSDAPDEEQRSPEQE